MIDAALTVRRARVHGAVDPATAPSRLASVLGGGELVPAGLPPAAVLCVRRLADPAPGVLPLDAGRLRPPPEWERAFVDQLTRLLAAAARPAREAVPADAGAVYFADRAELLACLARDARDGSIWTRWWWRSLAPAAGPRGDPVIEAWISTPEHVPAALALLAVRGEAEPFVAALPLSVVHELAARVAAAFGAVELERTIVRAFRAARAIARGPDDVVQRTPRTAPVARAGAAPVAPWSALVPEAVAQPLAPARALFLGVALSLRRAPAFALRAAFARDVAAWLEPATEPLRAASAAAPVPSLAVEPIEAEAGPPVVPRPAARRRARAVVAPASAPTGRAVLPEDARRPRIAGAEVSETAAFPAAHVVAPEPVEAAHAEAAAPSPPARARRVPAPPRTPPAGARTARVTHDEPQPLERVAPRADASPDPEPERPELLDDILVIGVETGLGGVFYLLNLFLYLGLYGDFTSPREPGIALDPWECVARVARCLVSRERRGDAVWRILERLAGAHDFHPPRAWRIPRAWLQPFDASGVWRWSAAGGTLRVAHPAGFTALAVPRNGEPVRVQLERELRRLRVRPELRRVGLGREPADPLDRWTARLAAYVRARLVLALGLDLERDVFARRARVFVTDSHVDVVLSLSDLPLAVRFAGLDRTPGFVPAAGRFVAFHFE